MFGSLGVPELIFILVLALLIFGPRKLPEIGRTLGRGMAEFRKASTDLKRTLNAEVDALDDDIKQRDQQRSRRPAAMEKQLPPPKEPIEVRPAEAAVARGASGAEADVAEAASTEPAPTEPAPTDSEQPAKA